MCQEVHERGALPRHRCRASFPIPLLPFHRFATQWAYGPLIRRPFQQEAHSKLVVDLGVDQAPSLLLPARDICL